MHIIVFLLLTGFVFGQHSSQPQKESSTDLRTNLVILKIVDVQNSKVVWLERTSNLDYFLRLKRGEETEEIQKIPTPDAKKLDQEFASKFLKIQYELPPSDEGCKITLRLAMKGESQEVCDKDDKKTQELIPFLQELESRF